MKAAFWRFAHRRYQVRTPILLTQIAAFVWFGFVAMVYGAALIAGWRPAVSETIVGIMLIGAPLIIGLLHRGIRIEASKGPGALYRKRLETNR